MFIAKGKKTVLLEDILKVVSELDILSHYLNIDKVPTVINSPLRSDKTPSMGLYTSDGSKISYTDFKTKDRGGTFDLLSNMWGLSFNDTLIKISNEIKNIKEVNLIYEKIDPKTLKSNFSEKIRAKQIVMSSDIQLKVKTREWKDYDLKYWEESCISLPWLIFGEIYPISHIFTKSNGDNWTIIPADKYAYVYVEHKDGNESIKIYQPFSEKFKWRNKHDGSVWDLWNQLPPKGDKLIITSSRKDALCIWENSGIPSVSLQSETQMPKAHVVNQLKKRFKKIFVLYDNDFNKEVNTGKINSLSLCELFDLIYIEIPEASGEKDPSDIGKRYGRKVIRNLINKLTTE